MTAEQMKILEKLAAENNYGRGPNHAKQVRKLSLKIYDELVRLDMLKKNALDKQILNAAALLHDIGVGNEPHNKAAFLKLVDEIPKLMSAQPLSVDELSAILYCVLFHRGHDFTERKEWPLTEPERTKRLASILRIADGLDYGPPFDNPVNDVSLKPPGDNGSTIICQVEPRSKTLQDRVKNYCSHTQREKVDLFKMIFDLHMIFELKDC